MSEGDDVGVFVRAGFPFNYDTEMASLESSLDCTVDEYTGEVIGTMAQQQFAEECDINTIVKRFGITGQLPQGVRMPTYEDFSDVTDFKTALDAIALAHEAFDQMPAEVRARFGNDPQEFVAFCSDDSNRAEAEKLGLVPAQKVVDIDPVAAASVPASNTAVTP